PATPHGVPGNGTFAVTVLPPASASVARRERTRIPLKLGGYAALPQFLRRREDQFGHQAPDSRVAERAGARRSRADGRGDAQPARAAAPQGASPPASLDPQHALSVGRPEARDPHLL